jgi:ABC-type multidrug transport system fused ATPase/permease subunit
MRRQVRPLSLSAALSVVRIGAELIRPWPLAIAVDYAIDGTPLPFDALSGISPQLLLIVCGVAVVLISIAAGLLDMFATRSAERAAERIGSELRRSVFDRSIGLSLRWHDRLASGELVSRLTTDVRRLLDAIVALTASLVPAMLTLVGVLLLLLTLDAGLALVGLTVVPILAVLSIQQRRKIKAAQQAARAESGRLAGTTSDLLRNVRAIQAFGRADRAGEIFRERNDALLKVDLRAVQTETRWSPLSDAVLAVGAGLVLIVGGLHVMSGAQSVGVLLVVIAYLRELYSPVRSLTRLSSVLAKAGASATRVADILDCKTAVTDWAEARKVPLPIRTLEMRDVRFAYDDNHTVLKDFNLDIAAGETVCLLGPSGSGKSTVLQLLLRLYDVDGGRVLVNGFDIRSLQQRSLREEIAYVPQDPWLLDGTVAENIAFGSRSASRAEVIEAGRSALVDEFIGRLPLGYDSPIGEDGARLSGGQRRRVAIARAAVSKASVVLLDEPTASLDPVAAAGIIRAIRTATRNRTTLIVTHDRALAQIADRIIVVHPVTATTNLGKNSPNSFKEGGVNHDYFEQPDSGAGFAQEPQSLTEPVS